MKALRLLGTLAVLAAVSPAASAGAQTPDNIARLERARAQNPRSAAALRSLGVAYYRAGRFADARPALEQARALSRNDGTVALYLGMTAERTGDLPTARASYAEYLQNGRSRGVKRQIRARLATLRRLELQAAAKGALAQETALAAEPGAASAIAVLPLTFSGADSTLAPLGRGLADLLITDLGRSPKLTVLERDRIQTLVDEMQRANGGGVDAATAVRSGRLMRAGRVVQGALSQRADRQLAVDAAVIDVGSSQAVKSVARSDALEQLFTVEKQLAFDLFDALGVTLTPAERALVEQRPTRSLAAFLAYSAGLMAEDNGNLDDASRHYADAVRIDPNFRVAREHQEAVDEAREGEAVSTASMEATLSGTNEGLVVTAADRGVPAPTNGGGPEFTGMNGTLTETLNDLNPSPVSDAAGGNTPPSSKDPASTTSGTDNPAAGSGRIRVVIPQPRRSRP